MKSSTSELGLRQVSPRLFADNTNLTVTGEIIEEVESAINNDLLRIKEWLLATNLSLNVAKTEFLLIGYLLTIGYLRNVT